MILESFTIENWACIKRVEVPRLPQSGIVVLHGRNGTGKSSIVAALRAALFDYKANSDAGKLKQYFPTHVSDFPKVTIGFQAGGQSYRVIKEFRKSGGEQQLQQQSGTGWNSLARSSAEVHDLTLELVGGKKSELGLQQLLWLDQTQFSLPRSDTFDADLQSRLRNILGVMQTPLDDAFITRVKSKWKEWHDGRSVPGKEPKYLPTSKISKDLALLESATKRQQEFDAEYLTVEALLKRAEQLEDDERNYRRELDRVDAEVDELNRDTDRMQERRRACAQAQVALQAASAKVEHALAKVAEREQALTRLNAAQEQILAAQEAADIQNQSIADQNTERDTARAQSEEGRLKLSSTSGELSRLEAGRQLQAQNAELAKLLANFEEAQRLHRHREELDVADRTLPAPTANKLTALEKNRADTQNLRAQLDAAAMVVTLSPRETGRGTIQIDDGIATSTTAGRIAVSRRAVIVVPEWGQIEIARGSDQRSLDEIEKELAKIDAAFRKATAEFGFTGLEPDVLKQLQLRQADSQARKRERTSLEAQMKTLGADDLPALQADLLRRETLTRQSAVEWGQEPVPAEVEERHASLRKERIGIEKSVQSFDAKWTETENLLEETRKKSMAAERALAGAIVAAEENEKALGRLSGKTDLEDAFHAAQQEKSVAEKQVADTTLTAIERELQSRLDDALERQQHLKTQFGATRDQFLSLKGQLTRNDGLHQKRMNAAAAVDTLSNTVDRAKLEAKSYDRLYELFEECRHKQLGTVTGPVVDRVIRWMNQLGINDYASIECDDSFLPVRLRGNNPLELVRESTGTQEQIGLMLRLALGSLLAPPGEAAVAVLDDPLSHSDRARLTQINRVLKSAADGDPAGKPSAGPLQILIFTCHPEWFPVDAAHRIDLGDPAILQRY